MLKAILGLSIGKKVALAASSLVFGTAAIAIVAPPPESIVQEAEQTPIVMPRETVETVTETEEIPFATEEVNDDSIPRGETRVRAEGKDGIRTITHRVTLIDGEEVKREKISDTVTTAQLNKVVAIGTYVAPPPPPPSPPPTSGVVKLSRTGICHAPGTTYYNQTTNFTPYSSLNACLGAGGRLPLR